MDQPIHSEGAFGGAAVAPINRRTAAISASRNASICRAVQRIGSPPAVETPRAPADPVHRRPAALARRAMRRGGGVLDRHDEPAAGRPLRHRSSRPAVGRRPASPRLWSAPPRPAPGRRDPRARTVDRRPAQRADPARASILRPSVRRAAGSSASTAGARPHGPPCRPSRRPAQAAPRRQSTRVPWIPPEIATSPAPAADRPRVAPAESLSRGAPVASP